jgi:hypothetical protein
MTQYMIKQFPPELHKAAKIRAAEEEITLQELILRAIRGYLTPDWKKESYKAVKEARKALGKPKPKGKV